MEWHAGTYVLDAVAARVATKDPMVDAFFDHRGSPVFKGQVEVELRHITSAAGRVGLG
jgi:hypothetical protein